MRDYVDARFSIGEVLIPVMFLVILLTLIPDAQVQTIGILALWAFFIVAVVDVVILGFLLTRKLKAKFGEDKAERVRWYAAMRALQLRPLRLPKPQVKRGPVPVLSPGQSLAYAPPRTSGTRVSSSLSDPCWPIMASACRFGSRRS